MKRIIFALSVVVSSYALAQEASRPWLDNTKSIEQRVELLLGAMTPEEKISQMMDESPAIERLGIEEYYWWGEALHGVARSAKATVFPQSIGLGATFDNKLMSAIGSAISDEARAINNAIREKGQPAQKYMGLTFWSPNVNIFRDPRWGRGQETFGEDPLLSGALGAAFIKGMQGDNNTYLKAASCAKHFTVHSGPEAERHGFNAIANPKDLNETYLPAFKACVDADVEAVMCAYNRTNDAPCCGSTPLLKDILRGKWGFDGHIVSDCGAVADIYSGHHYTKDSIEASVLALKNGVNLNCGSNYKNLIDALEKGLVTEQELDESLAVLLTTRFKLGLFDPVEANPYNKISTDVINSQKHKDLALQAARKSIVLLKNEDNLLPLKKDIESIYVSGPLAGTINSLIGNYYGLSPNFTTIVEGITEQVSPTTRVTYAHGQLLASPAKNPLKWYNAGANRSDVTIAVVGKSILLEGEEGESPANGDKGDTPDMKLPPSQLEMLQDLSGSAKKNNHKIVVVVCSGSPIDLSEIEKLADAIIYAWYPGEQGGRAVADIVFGNVSPSGKLPITFPVNVEQLPAFNDYSMKGRTYKYMTEKPMYPFGYGLTYSNVSIETPLASKTVVKKKNEITVTSIVTNMGNKAVEEVVQLYIRFDGVKGTNTPQADLRAYKKVSLKPGQQEYVSFNLKPSDFNYINNEGNYVRHKGKATIIVGNASPGERSSELNTSISSSEITVK